MGESLPAEALPPKLYIQDRFFAKYLDAYFPRWLRPNHITVFRMLLVPLMAWVLLKNNYALGIPLFVFGGLTDWFDGSLARVRRQITDWGIVYDPIADKLLIGAALVAVLFNHASIEVALILLSLEVMMLVGNILLRQFRIVQPANAAGKTKMVLEVIGIFLLLLSSAFHNPTLTNVGGFVLVGAVVAAIISVFVGFAYVSEKPKS